MKHPKINQAVCCYRGTCVNTCTRDVFDHESGEVIVAIPGNCIHCGECADECPAGAITLTD